MKMAILSVSTIRASFNSKSSRTAVPYVNRLLSGAGASWIASGSLTRISRPTDYEYWQRIAVYGGLIVRLNRFLACSREHPAAVTKSQRAKVYRDVFRGQWRRWGRVHPDWWEGLLDYSKNERQAFWSTLVPTSGRARVARLLSNFIRSRSSKFTTR